jgi:hypothetical protein
MRDRILLNTENWGAAMNSLDLGTPVNGKVSGSFRDPCGHVFYRDGVVYRRINPVYAEDYRQLIQSGLYDRLAKDGLLIPHEEVTLDLPQTDRDIRIIRPDMIEQVAYPYEFCFSQLRDAALLTLKVQRIAMEYGMSLKDSSAYNIQFHNGRPILIDTLSFERYRPDEPWIAYGQFCRHFLAPLVLMATVDVRLNGLFRICLDGVPLDLASSLLSVSARIKPSTFLHIVLHAKTQRRFANRTDIKQPKITHGSAVAIVDHLLRIISKIRYTSRQTEWSGYYDQHSYSEPAFIDKKRIVARFIDSIRPHKVWDLGGNTGVFSRLASGRSIFTVCFDSDPDAVETNYLTTISNKERYLLPLVLDLTNPSPATGWDNEERLSFAGRGDADLIMALALVHHLAISGNIPLEMIADCFRKLGRFLIVEFVPKEDGQVQRLLSTRKDIFENYECLGFEQAFGRYYLTHARVRIEDSCRWLYLMERKS